MLLGLLYRVNGWAVAGPGGAPHIAGFLRWKRPGAVHGFPIIPHHKIDNPPFLGVDKLPLGSVFH